MSISINHQNDQIVASSQILTLPITGGLLLPNGNNTSQKPSVTGNNGLIRYNTNNNVLEAVINGAYVNLATINDIGNYVLVAGSTMTGTLVMPAGSSSFPSLTFVGGGTVGFFTPTATSFGITVNNGERLRIDSSGNVMIGTTSATAPLTVSKNTTALPAAPSGTIVNFASADGTSSRITLSSFGSHAAFTGMRADGTNASKTGLVTADLIVAFDAYGTYNSSSYSPGARASIQMYAAENWSSTTQGAYISFSTTQIGTTTLTEKFRITDSGNVGIGITAPFSSLDVSAKTDAIILPTGTTAQRPHPAQVGMVRYNTDLQNLEIYGGPLPSWISFGIGQCQAQFKNLKICNHPTDEDNKHDITCDQLILQDNNGHNVRCNDVTCAPDITQSGVDGLDTGTCQPNTWYHAWVIYDGDEPHGLYSLSATAPSLPAGFPYCGRLGAVRTDGSKKFYRTAQYGRKAQYTVTPGTNTSGYRQMASGTAGDPTSPTWIAVDTTPHIPPTASHVHVCLATQGHSGSSGRNVSCAPNNSFGSIQSNATNPPPIYLASTTTSDCSLNGTMALESSNVYWASQSGAGMLNCIGWDDNL